MRSRTALLLALAVGLSACTFGRGPEGKGFRPAYRQVGCPPEIATIILTDVSCGTLKVLSRHGDPKGGTLSLFVAKISPGANQSQPDPVLSLGGDLGVAPDYATLGAQAAGLGRELIALDVRGTGRSEPSLVCPEVEALPSSPVSVPINDPRTRREFLTAVAACHDRLVAQEVDLAAFDLREMAADAEDLRNALGIGRWNVMALGTTSRIALEYLRHDLGPIRAVVLDSPDWPGVDPFVQSVQATRHAIAELLAACAPDPVCQRLTSTLRRDLDTVFRRLRAEPYVADLGAKGRILFDDAWFLVWLRARLAFIRPPGTFVPHAIAEFARGSVATLRMQAPRLVGGEAAGTSRQLCHVFLPNCWTHLVRSFGLYLSVMCRDVVPFTDASSLPDLVGDDPAFQDVVGQRLFLDACRSWGAGRGDPAVATPVRSHVPVLVIVGRFDPFGMLPFARRAMSTLANSTLVVSPVNGHVVTGTEQTVPDFCMVRIRDAWVDDPNRKPDHSCIGKLRIDYRLPLDWKL
jgi:pimeloyl-ACP methyl ester carboxylesterase